VVLDTGLYPGVSKAEVTSPGGVRIEGVHQLEKGGLRAALMNAVRAATEKSQQFSKRSGGMGYPILFRRPSLSLRKLGPSPLKISCFIVF
jgi:hypothetical protein